MTDTVILYGVFGHYGKQNDGTWWSSALLELRNTEEEAKEVLEDLRKINRRWDELDISVVEVDRSRIRSR